MIPVKNCHFCLRPTMYVPLATDGYPPSKSSQRILKIHFCSQCRAEYVFWANDGAVSSISLYTTIGLRMYRWSIQPNDTVGRLYYIEHPGIAGEIANKGIHLLKTFEERPELTPDNVEEKIRLMLTFM